MDLARNELNGKTFKWIPDRFEESEPKNGLLLTFQIKTLKNHKIIIIKQGMGQTHKNFKVIELSLNCLTPTSYVEENQPWLTTQKTVLLE